MAGKMFKGMSDNPSRLGKNIVCWIFGLLKLGCTIAIICILSLHLQDVNYTWEGNTYAFTDTCLVWTDITNYEACSYIYAVCGISLMVSLCVSILLCCTCNLCGVGGLIEWALSVFGVVWWVIAACFMSDKGSDANDADLPGANWRNANIGLSWAMVFCYSVTLIIISVTAIQGLMACCAKRKAEKAGGRGDDRKEDRQPAADTAPKQEPKPSAVPKKHDIAAAANAV